MTRKDLGEQRECWGEEEWSQRRHHETQSEQDGKYIDEVNEPRNSKACSPWQPLSHALGGSEEPSLE